MYDELYVAGLVAAGTTGLLFAYRCCRKKPTRKRIIQRDNSSSSLSESESLTDTLTDELFSSPNVNTTLRAINAGKTDRLYYSIQTVLDYLTPEKLISDGVYRLSGRASLRESLYNFMSGNSNGLPIRSASSDLLYEVNDILSAFKFALDKHIEEIFFGGEVLLLNLQALGNSPQPSLVLEAVQKHIALLRKHGKEKEAAFIHDYLHLGYRIQQYAEFNRMPAANVASLFTPNFQKLMRTQSHFELINKVLQTLVSQSCFENRYTQTYNTHLSVKERARPLQALR